MSIENRQLACILEILVCGTSISMQQGKAMEVPQLGRTVPSEEIKGAIKHSFTLLQYDSPTSE